MNEVIFVCYPRCTTCKKAEKWLVEHIFIKEETYYNLISYPDSPVKDYSRPTISRHKKRLLEKADTFLNEAWIKDHR